MKSISKLLVEFVNWFPDFIMSSLTHIIILGFCLFGLYYFYFRLFWIHIVINLYSFIFKDNTYNEFKKSRFTDLSILILFGFSVIFLLLVCKYFES